MVTDWEPEPGGQHLTPWFSAAKADDGRQLLQIIRLSGTMAHYNIVADADGAVLHALLGRGKCLAWHPTIGPTRAIYPIHDRKTGDEDLARGVLGSEYEQLEPKVYLPSGHQPSTVFSASYVIGRDVFVENSGPGKVFSLDSGELVATILTAPGDEGLEYNDYTLHGNDAFFIGASSGRSIVKVWTGAGGVKTLIGEASEPTRARYGFAVDGVDMVWGESSDRPSASHPYAINETWTAKYTTDPAAAAATKRRVRSEYISDSRYVVGCGYGANQIYPRPASGWGKGGLRVTRLSDGRSWEIVDRSREQLVSWRIRWPIAITCDEVFAVGLTGDHYEVVRIRLDSIGPGVDAD